MRTRDRRIAGLLIIVGVFLSGCAPTPDEEELGGNPPATIAPIEGSDLVSITLTPEAAERIGLRTDTIREEGSATVIPYSAVFYGPEGDTWTYTEPEPLTYVREPITIDHFEGEQVVLSDGPPSGTVVVMQGASELFGTETGVDS
jgi:hypothetical protein